MLQCFPPLIDDNAQILIIGTMPSVKSLDRKEYYAHPRNAFWKIIATLFNNGSDFSDFAEKKACILKNHLALWDNLKFCERQGSLDSNIKNMIPNDFETLLKTHPHISHLIFNGKKSFQIFKKFHPNLLEKYPYFILPSTSPANATLSVDKKFSLWQDALLKKNLENI